MQTDRNQDCEITRTERLKDALGVVSNEVDNVLVLQGFVDHTIDDLAAVTNWPEAERMLNRLLSVAERLTGEQVTRLIENSIRNGQVYRSGRLGEQMAELFRRTVLCSATTKASWMRFYRFVSNRRLRSDTSEIQQLIESTILNTR